MSDQPQPSTNPYWLQFPESVNVQLFQKLFDRMNLTSEERALLDSKTTATEIILTLEALGLTETVPF